MDAREGLRAAVAPRFERATDSRLELVRPPLPPSLGEDDVAIGIAQDYVDDHLVVKRVQLEEALRAHVHRPPVVEPVVRALVPGGGQLGLVVPDALACQQHHLCGVTSGSA